MNESPIKVCILIPAHNPGERIFSLLKRIRSGYPELDILIIDDGSEPPVEIDPALKKISLLRNAQNQGKGFSLIKGFRNLLKTGKYTHVLTMDADLQHLPEEIRGFMREYPAEKRILYGRRRFQQSVMPLHRIISNSVTSLLISIRINQRVFDSQVGFRLIPLSLLQKMSFCYGGFQTESELLIRAGMAKAEIKPVPISTVYRKEKSNINNFLDTLRFIMLFIHSYLWS